MLVIGEYVVASEGVPDLDGLVIAGGGDVSFIARPINASDRGAMGGVGVDVIAGGGVPDANSAGVIPRGNALAVGGPCCCAHFRGILAQSEDVRAARSLPDLQRFIVAAGGDQLSI